MDDEMEERVIKQALGSQFKFFSRYTIGFMTNLKLRPEFLFFAIVCFIFIFYLQALDANAFINSINRISNTFKLRPSKASFTSTSVTIDDSVDQKLKQSAAFSIKGRRATQEDRFVIEENINGSTKTSFFAIFDGHGGDMASQFAKEILVQNLYNKIIETKQIMSQKVDNEDETEDNDRECDQKTAENEKESTLLQRKPSGRKITSKTDEDSKNAIDSDILDKLKPQKGFSFFKKQAETPVAPPKSFNAKCYIQKGNRIDFGRMITDEILFADHKLLESAKKSSNIAGSTALIAIIDGQRLTVANVGDSRGVLCDHKGKTIPLSFDHKPQSAKEHKRIQEAGGFIAFKGVWRVSGILATSRALGDFPLKPNLVIANPDILEFDLSYHQPQFLILASDGLWDTFTNEEAVAFIKDHLDEPHFGAKSITLASYARGSVDNISTIVIRFKNGVYEIRSSDDA